MPSSYTNLLGLVLPTTGELNGTWGAAVNAALTQLLEDSVAGYATASVTGGDWTLSTTGGGAANEARMSALIATGTPGTPRSIFAPKTSKTYAVINKTDAVVTVKGGPTTPTTGVDVACHILKLKPQLCILMHVRCGNVRLKINTTPTLTHGEKKGQSHE